MWQLLFSGLKVINSNVCEGRFVSYWPPGGIGVVLELTGAWSTAHFYHGGHKCPKCIKHPVEVRLYYSIEIAIRNLPQSLRSQADAGVRDQDINVDIFLVKAVSKLKNTFVV